MIWSEEGKRLLQKYLFEDPNTVFDIERLFGIATGFLAKIADSGTGDAKPTASLSLRDPNVWRLTRIEAVELDGKPGDELMVSYQAADDDAMRAYDVIAWR